ncbi:MAG: glycosyltransferase family 9 protein [Gemmatimonadota bacterium]|nr:glycosyltransferase family 9 protein [Gemmatimonadota bacterium]
MVRKHMERRGKRLLSHALGRVLGEGTATAGESSPDLRCAASVLLIRQHNQLGDMLLSTPVFRAVRACAPNARIDLVAGPENLEAVRGNAHLDEVLLFDKAALRSSPRRALAFLRRLRSPAYEVAIVMNTVAFSVTAAWIAVLSGARQRVGRAGPGGLGADMASGLFHHVLPAPTPGRHQSDVNLDLVTPLGADGGDRRCEIFLTEQEAGKGRLSLDAAIGPGRAGSARVVLHPGAGKIPNRWSAARFGEVASALVRDGHRVVLAAGPGEEHLLHEAEAAAEGALPRLPSMGIRELAGSMAEADLIVANDTGVLHFAAATRTSTLALFGPTDAAEWCPADVGVEVLAAPGADLDSLPVEAVRAAARRMATAAASSRPGPAAEGIVREEPA